MPTALIGLGTEQLTVSTTSVGFASIPARAQRAYIRVDDANIFMENDGTAATSTAGMQVNSGSFIDLTDGVYDLIQFRFIREAGTDAALHINYYV
mgnify:FL=1